MNCNCSLAGTIACTRCHLNPWIDIVVGPTITWYSTYPTYNEDRYELVEKKDWKINQLKVDIENKKRTINDREHQLVEMKEDLELLEIELKKLES